MIRYSLPNQFVLAAGALLLVVFGGASAFHFLPNIRTSIAIPNNWKLVKTTKKEVSRTSSSLFYKNLPDEDPDAPPQPAPKPSLHQHLAIPILGPFLRAPPLLPIGEERNVSPTPMQWQSLEECVLQHQLYWAKKKKKQQPRCHVAGVSAAPLIAILDEYTVAPGQDRGARYATLAAVVGIVEKKNTAANNVPTIDTSDNQSFMESLVAAANNNNSHGDRNKEVRLMGIGRAVVTDFHYQVPLALQLANMDEEGHLILDPSRRDQQNAAFVLLPQQVDSDECEMPGDDDDDDARHECDTTDSIIMARFRLYQDKLTVASSPVHALSEMSAWTTKIHMLHEERKQLVTELRQKQQQQRAQKDKSSIQSAIDRMLEEDELHDHDGLGDLFASKQQTIKSAETSKSTVASTAPSSLQSSIADGSKDTNFGLGTSAACVSTLAALTAAIQTKLQPYYSPQKHASEEHYFELYSFVAVQALMPFVGPSHTAWAVRCSTTAERLRVVHEWMHSHVQHLQEQLQPLPNDGD